MLDLGAAAHFSAGWPTEIIDDAAAMGVASIRDSLNWERVEHRKGRYDFSDARSSYIDEVLDAGLDVTLLFHPEHYRYDRGGTVYSNKGVDAFADFIVASLDRFDRVKSIEIGNEFNGNNFVTGHVVDQGYGKRAEYYARIVSEVADRLNKEHPDVEIVGGALHSIPIGYVNKLDDAGVLDDIDAIALHPYTTPPEQLAQQLKLLDAATGGMPVHVTEFVSNFDDPREAADYLLKMTTAMAEAGVEVAKWYALYEQPWYEHKELLRYDGTMSPAGRGFEFIQETILDQPTVERLDTEGSTHFYLFGDNVAVLWGERQKVEFTAPVKVYDATGTLIDDFDGMIDPDEPVVVVSKAPIALGSTLLAEGSGVLAHSFYDFDVIRADDDPDGFEGPWSYFEERGDGRVSMLYTMPGGERSNEPWTPYIGHNYRRPLMIEAERILPFDFSRNHEDPRSTYAILERFTAEDDETVTIEGFWDVNDSSADGVSIEIRVNGTVIHDAVVFDPSNGHVYDVEIAGIALSAGDTIDFVTGPNGNSNGGDLTERTFKVKRQSRDEQPKQQPPKDGDDMSDDPSDGNVPDDDGRTSVLGTSGADNFDFRNLSDPLHIELLSGNDTAEGGAAGDLIEGGAGKDVLTGNGGADTLRGGPGNDDLYADASDVVDGGEGLDFVQAVGDDGVAIDLALASIESARGSRSDDLFDGSGSDAELSFDGRGGRDTLIGGAGDDWYKGHNHADHFVVFVGGSDFVNDFDPKEDVLVLAAAAFADFDDVMDAATDTGRGVSIAYDTGEVFLRRIALGELTEGNVLLSDLDAFV